MADGESLEHARERREFDLYLSRQMKFLFGFLIVMLVVSPPLMILCAFLAEGQEVQVESEDPQGD